MNYLAVKTSGGTDIRNKAGSTVEDIITRRDGIAAALERTVLTQIRECMPALAEQNPDIDWMSILNLLERSQNVAESEVIPALQSHLADDAGKPDSLKTDVFSHFYSILQTVRSYTPVLMERAAEAETGKAFYDLAAAIHTMKEQGCSLEDAIKFFDEVKISKSFTAHPTEGLSENGIALCRELVEAAEHPERRERQKRLEAVINRMILNRDFGASRKKDIVDEIDSSNHRARIQNEGADRLEKFIIETLEKEYGQPAKFYLDIVPRSWDYDADGKNNAEGWAMLYKMSLTTLGALDDTLQMLATARNLDPSLKGNRSLAGLESELETVRQNLRPVLAFSGKIVRELALYPEAEERQAAYEILYPTLQEQIGKFGEIYDFTDVDGRGFYFYLRVLERLDDLRERLRQQGSPAAAHIDKAFRFLRRNGFVLEKGQTRHNDLIHKQIIDNLFNHPPFRERGILDSEDWALIDDRFSDLGHGDQYRLLFKVTDYCFHNGNRRVVLQDMFDANPLAFEESGNGYPAQERTLLDRFRLRALYPLKFDQGIIADCGAMGPTRQMFLGDLFGIHNMRHMPLYEDRSTLAEQAELFSVFLKYGGRENRARRKHQTDHHPEWKNYRKGREVHEMYTMRACSDTERLSGSGTRLEAFSIFRQQIRKAYEARVPVEIMLGGGMSMERFGGDPGVVRRVAAQELKAIALERGKPFSRHDKTDRRMMRSALAILYTEQGRAKRYYTATPAQAADDAARRITEMIYDRLDLEGLVPDYSHIAKPQTLPAPLDELAPALANRAIDDFMRWRFAVPPDESAYDLQAILTNRVAKKVTCPHTIAFMNNGARPASKSGAKEMTEVRAIENNQRDYVSRLHAGGYYSAGNLMKGLWQEIREGRLTADAARQFLDNPLWRYNFFIRNLADAGRADFTRALGKLGWAEATFDDLIKTGGKVEFVKTPDGENTCIAYDDRNGAISAEQAYIAKIFYDRILFLGLVEAALDGTLDRPLEEIIAAVRPQDNSHHASSGALTRQQFRDVVAIIEEHRRNLPGYALQFLLEDYIAPKVEAGGNKEEIIAALGGVGFLRRVAAAYRAGTLPHWPLWAGVVNYGQKRLSELSAKVI